MNTSLPESPCQLGVTPCASPAWIQLCLCSQGQGNPLGINKAKTHSWAQLFSKLLWDLLFFLLFLLQLAKEESLEGAGWERRGHWGLCWSPCPWILCSLCLSAGAAGSEWGNPRSSAWLASPPLLFLPPPPFFLFPRQYWSKNSL